MGTMVEIITVHGTFAGDSADKGDKWWQQDSPFLEELQSHVEEKLEVRPFHWSGANSELDRRKASNALARTILNAKEPPLVIGHSHGGSVSFHTLALLAIRKQKTRAREALRGLITVGTPMILFRANNNPFTRFNLTGRLLLLLGLSIGLLYSFEMLADIFAPDQLRRPLMVALPDNLMRFFASPEPWLALGVLGVLYAYSRRTVKRRRLFAGNRLADLFAGRVTSLSHWQDEAIRALSHGKDLKPKLVQFRSLFAGIFSALAFGLLFVQFASQLNAAVVSERHFYGPQRAIGEPIPRSFILGDPSFPLEIADDRRSWRMHDLLRAGELYTREQYYAIPLIRLWDDDEVNALLATPEGAWLAHIRDSLPPDRGVVFRPESAKNDAYIDFANFLQKVAQFGSGAEWSLDRQYDSGEEEPYAPEDVATYYHLFGTQSSPDLPDDRRVYMTNDMMSWIFSDAPHSDFGLDADGTPAILPHSALVRVPFEVAQQQKSCNEAYAPIAIDGMRDQRWERLACRAFYTRDNRFVYEYVFNFDTGKYELLRFLLRGGQFQGQMLTPGLELIAYGEQDLFYELVGLSDHPDNYDKPLYPHREFLFVLVLSGVLIAVSATVAALLALLLTPILSALLTGTLRSTAYGNDGFGEQIESVHPNLDFRDDTVGNLPDDVSEEIISNSMADAPEALARIRTLLGGGDLTGLGGADPLSVATKFEKSELIHNAYFHSRRFIKYVAAILVEQYGLTPSARFANDAEATRYRSLIRNGLTG